MTLRERTRVLHVSIFKVNHLLLLPAKCMPLLLIFEDRDNCYVELPESLLIDCQIANVSPRTPWGTWTRGTSKFSSDGASVSTSGLAMSKN